MSTAGWPGSVAALFPDPDPARAWLRRELDRPEYRPSLVARFWHAVQDLFDRVRDATVAGGGFNPVVALVVLGLLVCLAALVLSRLRANPAAPGGDRAVFTASRMSAADHRALADQALDREDWDMAVVESTRALASGLFERGLVVEETGATADEIAARAVGVFPAARERLAARGAGLRRDDVRRPARRPSARRPRGRPRARDAGGRAPRPGRARTGRRGSPVTRR